MYYEFMIQHLNCTSEGFISTEMQYDVTDFHILRSGFRQIKGIKNHSHMIGFSSFGGTWESNDSPILNVLWWPLGCHIFFPRNRVTTTITALTLSR